METINAENKFKYIIPPLSRKAIIDKTAKFVAVHGRQIEEGMLNQAKEKTAASFTFLLEDDPYHGYYLAKIQENIDNPNAAQQQEASSGNNTTATTTTTTSSTANSANPNEIVKAPTSSEYRKSLFTLFPVKEDGTKNTSSGTSNAVVSPPEPLFFYLTVPQDITEVQLETMKLAARSVAINGKRFVSDIQALRMASFEYIYNPSHPHYDFFQSIVKSYVKILENPTMSEPLIKKTTITVMDKAIKRYTYEKKNVKVKDAAEKLEDRKHFLEIDWHDFVVVETINFTDPEEERKKQLQRAQTDLIHQAAEAFRSAISSTTREEDEINLIRNYQVIPEQAKTSVPMVKLDNGRSIPVSEMNQHIKEELKDPKWRENQERFEQKQKDTNIEADSSIYKNLAKMAGARPDVFGGEVEAAERRLEEMRKREAERIIWDGKISNAADVKQKIQEQLGGMSSSSGGGIGGGVLFGNTTQQAMGTSLEGVEGTKRYKTSFLFSVIVPPSNLTTVTRLSKLESSSYDVDEIKTIIAKELGNVALGKFQLVYGGQFLKKAFIPNDSTGDYTFEVKWKTR